MTRNLKGTVTVRSYRGTLRIYIPRHVCGGEPKYLYLGLPDTPENRKAAEMRAQAIAADIAFDRFDATLNRYRPSAIQTEDNLPLLSNIWQQYVAYKSKTLAASTIDKDFKRVANHIANLPTQRLREARKIRKHLINSLAPASAKKILMHLSACCDWAAGEDLIQENPFKNLPRVNSCKKSNASIDPFTKPERDSIISAFEASSYYKHYAAFVKFLFLTGCRTSEAIGLQWKHISSDLREITFSEALVEGRRKGTKTGTIRKFPVNSQLRSLLEKLRATKPAPNELVFKSPTGLAIDSHNFLNRAWKQVISSLSIRYRPQYNTRHTFISLCLQSGVQVVQVAQWVGNSPKTIWQHYAGLVSSQQVPEFD